MGEKGLGMPAGRTGGDRLGAPDEGLGDRLSLAEKVERSVELIRAARERHGDGLVVSHSLGKDSAVVWRLAKKVDPAIRGFIVTTDYKPAATVTFMAEERRRYPELRVYRHEAPLDVSPLSDPEACCRTLKVEPLERALADLGATCWVTGLRRSEGPTRTGLREHEVRPDGLEKLHPLALWLEREIWQYLAVHQVPVNPLYGEGYRSLGCAPCSAITFGPDERGGRWVGTAKHQGECGLHSGTTAQNGATP